MSAYFQMGHNSENLIGAQDLEYAGIILSPVNRSYAELSVQVPEFRKKGNFDILLDPQLYCPHNQRGFLPSHSYYPEDLETADLSNLGWWAQRVDRLVDEATALGVNGICSPAVLPGKYDDVYFSQTSEIYTQLCERVKTTEIRPILTLCVSLKELADPNDALSIASIITSVGPKWCYLVIEANHPPRREIVDEGPLLGVLALAQALEGHGCKIIVSHASSDMILFKAAGVSHCATGKFFNLRRFTRSRFEVEGEDGGRNVPYWFEHGLLAFLREADLAALSRAGFSRYIGVGNSKNIYGKEILEQLRTVPGKAWVALGWKHYLAWFCLTEKSLSMPGSLVNAKQILKAADDAWSELEAADLIFDERLNNGEWIRRWRRVLATFK